MTYDDYTAIDFALDENFRRWVKQSTPETERFWNEFIDRHPDKRPLIAEARLLVSRLKVNAETASPEQMQQLWERIRQDIQPGMATPAEAMTSEPETPVVPLRTASLRRASLRSRWSQPVRWAAVWVGLLLLAGLAYYRFGYDRTTQYQTAYGEKKTVTLPDGSVVTLNGHSTLTVDGWNGADDREVRLDGEAFFAVTRRQTPEGQPVKFRVRTADLNIDVLGTRFNVSYRRQQTEVVLQEGKVQVSRDRSADLPTVMKPGDKVTYSASDRRLSRTSVDPELVTSWRDNLLVFKDKPVSEIAQILSDSYGIEVDFVNREVAARRFSGSVPTDSVDVFFAKLEKLYGVSVRREGRRYRIE